MSFCRACMSCYYGNNDRINLNLAEQKTFNFSYIKKHPLTNQNEFTSIVAFNNFTESPVSQKQVWSIQLKVLSPLTYRRWLHSSSLLLHHTGETSASARPILCF